MGRQHISAIRRLSPLAEPVAVVEPQATAREEAAATAPGLQAYASLEELIDSGGVDAAHVCTPPETHDEVTLRLLEAGVHTYVEKPFASSTAAAEALLQAAGERNLILCPGHQLLFEWPSAELERYRSAVAPVSHVESYFSFRPVRRAPGGRVPLRPDLQLLDILPHPLYLLLRHLKSRDGREPVRMTGLEVGPKGTVHALLRQGELTGSLFVSLHARPVESFLRISGENGSLTANFVTGTVQRSIGPGASGIDKAVAPYHLAGQLLSGTTRSLFGRVLRRERSYPGLKEAFEAFYEAIRTGGPSPVDRQEALDTVAIWEEVRRALEPRALPNSRQGMSGVPGSRSVLVTGGTGLLGAMVAEHLASGAHQVRVISRRHPAPWDRIPGVEYQIADLAKPLPDELFEGVDAVVHCAAETAGGWEEHEANSVRATRHVVEGAARGQVPHLIQISSIAVLQASPDGSIPDEARLLEDERGSGPYVWGKLVSERLAVELGEKLGVDVSVVRPGAIVDNRRFNPPGRLGKRIGPAFVAVGPKRDEMGVVDLSFAASTLAWLATHPQESPSALNLLDPDLPTRRTLVERLRVSSPGIRVFWLPRPVLWILDPIAGLAQRLLRRGRPPIKLRNVFGSRPYTTEGIRRIATAIEDEDDQPSLPLVSKGVGGL